ncbi:hypothetical protein L1887_22869 [Cichorium endivia]|nr:hypothetical protein L1887_22869 [Cichorium endivia]
MGRKNKGESENEKRRRLRGVGEKYLLFGPMCGWIEDPTDEVYCYYGSRNASCMDGAAKCKISMKHSLEVVSSLGGELSSVKKAAAMDSVLLSRRR